ncbi:MAG: hypothetical protein AAGD11_20595 [Planctomycetota bacterium]
MNTSPTSSKFARLWLITWLGIAALLVGKAIWFPKSEPAQQTASAASAADVPFTKARLTEATFDRQTPSTSRTKIVRTYKAIETLRVGDRVVSDNPDSDTPKQTAVDPATWKKLTLYAEEIWPDGTLDTIHIETLQPPLWLELYEAQVGSQVPPPLDLVEMGLSADLLTTVVQIEPCPQLAKPLRRGEPGRVVLTTVNHLNNDVWQLTAENAAGRREQLKPTGFHKFYSETRRDWVSTHDIHDREVIRGRAGPLTIVAAEKLPGTQRVYNLTVEGEHVYYVSELGLLAHNNCNNFVSVDDISIRGHRNIEVSVSAADSLGMPIQGSRQTGINRAWALEVELIRRTGRGSRDWTVGEIRQILDGVGPTQIRSTRAPNGFTGHHINRVQDLPAYAGDPRNIHFLSRGAGLEHMRLGHPGGTRAVQPPGNLIDREALLRGGGL